ncbi:MAG: DALR domain-containing protein, partial [Candidatus Micrarchaeota archaeon]
YKGDDNSVYFSIKKVKDYGKLAHLDLSELKTGASGRVDADEYDKADARDFVLWKAWDKKDGDVGWETALGKGRPGWHLECSVMSAKYLGQPIDIHTGGVDLVFPHHENEIAQSEAAEGKKFVNYWLHNEHLLVDGKKMSKSLGNFFVLTDIEKKGYSPIALRFLFASTHYRSQLNLTWDSLEAAGKTVEKLNEFAGELSAIAKSNNGLPVNREALNEIVTAGKQFEEKMDDDLDAASALAAFFVLEKKVRKAIAEKTLDSDTAKQTLDLMQRVDSVFGFLSEAGDAELTDKEEALIEEREKAKRVKDYAKADKIREQLKKKGILLEDSADGVKWRVKR